MGAGRVKVALLAAVLLNGLLCCTAFAGAGERLLLTGSSTMAPLMKAVAGRFVALNPGVRIEVQAGGSGRGIADARQGRADIGMASRSLTDAEQDLFGFALARDGVTVIVHRDNPVKTLTNRQMADIYAGRAVNWKKFGGRDAPIVVLAARQGYSSTELFAHFLGIDYPEIKAHQVLGDNPTRIEAVAANPNAIVYVSVGEAERKARGGTPIKPLPVNGVEATSKNIRTGNYPISRPLLLVTRVLPAGVAKKFIEFSLSPQVTDLILAHDFVPYFD